MRIISAEISIFNQNLYFQNPDYLEGSYREEKLLDFTKLKKVYRQKYGRTAMDNIQILQECYSRVTLIPVVGSGLSIPMGLPSWRELIEKSADYFSVSDEKKECIRKCLDCNEYLGFLE